MKLKKDMSKIKNIAVIYFSHDGISSLYTGVGTSGRDICYSMLDIKKSLEVNGYNLTFYPGTIRYNKQFHGYSKSVREEVKKIANSFGTKIIEVENGSGGTLSYGNVNYWIQASQNASSEIDKLSNLYEHIIVISSDTPFAGVAQYTKSKNITHVWVPRSTAKIHSSFKLRKEDGSMDEFMKSRITWEENAVNFANTNKNSYIGHIGDFVKQHLMTDYGAKEDSLIEMRIGLYYPRLNEYKKSQEQIKQFLKDIGISADKGLLVSFARAEHYKGLDLVLKLGGYLEKKYDVQTIILTVPYSMDDPYIQELNKVKEEHNPNAIIIFGHDFITPHYLMQWEKTKIVAVLSRQEPTGLVPGEFRYYKNSEAQLLVSNKDGLPERVADGIDGFVCNIDNINDIIDKAEEIMNLSQSEKKSVSDAGYKTIMSKYYLPDNLTAMLQKLLTKLEVK
ncbi:MAG: glycosyltransferase [Candidatus Omnitrophica bacterium]|nr:glycosyltransferase [Candidatus Omnitrophota bacterium]